LTIKALAARAGVAYHTAHALYTGRATRIDLATLDRMCTALQVEPGELFLPQAAPAARAHDERGSGDEPASVRPAGPADHEPAGPR
jgi:DNA-binding Xre family transcriptional regulator